jgi:hypothetical protein
VVSIYLYIPLGLTTLFSSSSGREMMLGSMIATGFFYFESKEIVETFVAIYYYSLPFDVIFSKLLMLDPLLVEVGSCEESFFDSYIVAYYLLL